MAVLRRTYTRFARMFWATPPPLIDVEATAQPVILLDDQRANVLPQLPWGMHTGNFTVPAVAAQFSTIYLEQDAFMHPYYMQIFGLMVTCASPVGFGIAPRSEIPTFGVPLNWVPQPFQGIPEIYVTGTVWSGSTATNMATGGSQPGQAPSGMALHWFDRDWFWVGPDQIFWIQCQVVNVAMTLNFLRWWGTKIDNLQLDQSMLTSMP